MVSRISNYFSRIFIFRTFLADLVEYARKFDGADLLILACSKNRRNANHRGIYLNLVKKVGVGLGWLIHIVLISSRNVFEVGKNEKFIYY